MENYYINQLKKINTETLVNVKLTDFEGNETKSMVLNLESIQVIKDFLTQLETEIVMRSQNGT